MAGIVIPDVSEFQGAIDHQRLVNWLRATYGAAIIIARINYGNSKVDAQADANIDGLRDAGADAIGFYCYLIGADDPVADADVLVRVLQAHGGLRPNECIVCDDEEGGGDQSGRVNTFLARVDAGLRESDRDWWYSGLNFAIAHNLPAARGKRWVAAYGAAEPTAIPHDLWQFSDSMSFAGVASPCDASVFHGSGSSFLSLIGASAAQPAPSPPPPPPPPLDEEEYMDVAYVDLNAQAGWQYLMWVDAAGQLWLWGYHDQDAAKVGPAIVPGLPPLTARAPLTIKTVDAIKQVQVAVRAADGSAVHMVQGYGVADVLNDWSIERYGNPDGGMPIAPAFAAALAQALAPQIPALDLTKLEADLEIALPAADAAAVKAAIAKALAT